MKNNGLFFASDWTPFFNRQNMEEYEKGIRRGPGAADTAPKGELRVSFENAPPGMKVDPAGPGFQGISYDVGYTSIGRPY
ncbi:hypothetical protein [Kosakonia radicincitans]|uniref:hypothetical protein n=1 Tax=Kosakonia radicincitans TaxID=283686 RepID=UPI00164346BC|nr:hypothetical protein [Kosakonia radicincitans]